MALFRGKGKKKDPDLRYYSRLTSLSNPGFEHYIGIINNKAIVAGGRKTGNHTNVYNTVDVYDSSFTKSVIDPLSEIKWDSCHCVGNIGDYIIFCGGNTLNSSGNSDAVRNLECYDKYLTKINITYDQWRSYYGDSANVGNYLLFSGKYFRSGSGYQTLAIDNSLTISQHMLSVNRAYTAGANISNYAVFAGGSGAGSDYFNNVDAYNTSLTVSTIAPLDIGRYKSLAVSLSTCIIFGGGYVNNSNYQKYTDAYDSNLTKLPIEPLQSKANQGYASGWGSYKSKLALFFPSRLSDLNTVYNTSLVKSEFISLYNSIYNTPVHRNMLILGKYVIFFGGDNSDLVDAFKLT